jgi:hypothetical protein
MQLDQDILEDIFIASGTGAATPAGQQHCTTRTCGGAEISVVRIFSVLLNLDDDYEEDSGFDYDSSRSQKQSLLVKAAKLLDSYLAEVALDSNILPSKFISLVKLLPDHALSFFFFLA